MLKMSAPLREAMLTGVQLTDVETVRDRLGDQMGELMEKGKMYDKDLEDQANELKALGINVVDQLSLEQNVEAAVNEAVIKHSRNQKLQILKKEIKESKFEIKKAQNKEKDYEFRLSGMRQRLTDPRQYLAIEKTLEDTKQHLEDLKKKTILLEEKLVASNENEDVLDEIDFNLEEGEILEDEECKESESSCRTSYEKEQMIKQGQMTPFGTVVTNQTTCGSILKSLLTESSVKSDKGFRTEVDSIPGIAKKSPAYSTHKPTEQHNLQKISTKAALNGHVSEFEKYLQDQIDKQNNYSHSATPKKRNKMAKFNAYGIPKRKKVKPKEFIGAIDEDSKDIKDEDNGKSKKRNPLKIRILHPKRHWKERNLGSITSELESDQLKRPGKVLSECVPLHTSDSDYSDESHSDYVPSEEEFTSEEGVDTKREKTKTVSEKRSSGQKSSKKDTRSKRLPKSLDDGLLENYVNRIKSWKKERLKNIIDGTSEDEEDGYHSFDGGFKIPLSLWNKLYKYQKTCVKWLWELHCQNCGGILGDEMGLGKTIMVISFLVGMSYSGLLDKTSSHKGLGPILIVCPATVLHQWVREFHHWWPPFRVAVLHDSGTFLGKRSALIHNINRHDGILVTSYRGVSDQLKVLLNYDWHYIILDEGHKIRNPESQITVAVKRFQTTHRIILSGSPIQNSLKELWSLFDFIFPGKLGSLPVFLQQFATPITIGGYANASKLEVQTAFRCATVLRDTINPYLLRRMKKDVRSHLFLPSKEEQVLFCGLTEAQRTLYRDYLDGREVRNILGGRLQVFVGLINLRKMCNHPDLYDGGPKLFTEEVSNVQPEYQYGWWKRAGKMVVLHSILKLWQEQSHRVLLFTQSRQMLCILEKFIQDQGYTYLKMDGCTSVGGRQPLIQRYNNDPSIFAFILTTRVGGLGINLTGADRVVIYDPDWNPSTDTQARERAWRIGQTRHVTIYRLLTAGTIEEKIYHRQIFKQFLTNRVLKDPKQQRFFKTNDLYELFTLHEGEKEKTESAAIFAGTGSEIKFRSKGKEQQKEKGLSQTRDSLLKAREENKIETIQEKEDQSLSKWLKVQKESFEEAINPNKKLVHLKTELSPSKSNSLETKDAIENFKSGSPLRAENDLLNENKTVNIKNSHNKDPPSSDETDVCKTAENTGEAFEVDLVTSNKTRKENLQDKKNAEKNTSIDNTRGSKLELNEEEKRLWMLALAKRLSKKIAKKKSGGMHNKKSGRSEKNATNEEKGIENEKCDKKAKQRERSKNENDKNTKGKKFEGKRINNLVKKRKYKYSEEEVNDDPSQHKAQDEFVLRKLFKKSGVHTALSHDIIIDSGDQDYLLIESEADRVAKEALRQVRLSRKNCLRVSKSAELKRPKFGRRNSLMEGEKKKETRNLETFDGGVSEVEEESFEECAPAIIKNRPCNEPSSSGTLSSALLLKRMKERSRVMETPLPEIEDDSEESISESSSYSVDETPDISDPEIEGHVELLTDIRNFIAFQAETDGCASTEEVVKKFQGRLLPDQNPIFKALLGHICDFVRDSSGRGVWHLKHEFR